MEQEYNLEYSKDITLYQNPAVSLIVHDYELEYSKDKSVYTVIININDSVVLDINKYDITDGYICFFIGEYYEFSNINYNLNLIYIRFLMHLHL